MGLNGQKTKRKEKEKKLWFFEIGLHTTVFNLAALINDNIVWQHRVFNLIKMSPCNVRNLVDLL